MTDGTTDGPDQHTSGHASGHGPEQGSEHGSEHDYVPRRAAREDDAVATADDGGATDMQAADGQPADVPVAGPPVDSAAPTVAVPHFGQQRESAVPPQWSGEQSGYAQPGWEQSGYGQPGYEQSGYPQPGWEPSGYGQPGYEPSGYGQPGYPQPDYQPSPYEQPQFEQPRYEQPQYQVPQYEQPRYEQPQFEQPRYDPPRYEQPDTGTTGPTTTGPTTSPAAPTTPPAGQHLEPARPTHVQPGQQPAQVQPAAQYQPPATPPRPEDLLVPNQSPVTEEPATWGWRGRVNRASGGFFKPRAAAQEVVVRQAIAGIQRGFSKPMTVVVVQPKGGAGKTPTTICLSAAFGHYRGGYVVGWDDNETRGTLSVRVENPDDKRATVWDLLSDLPAFERHDARVGDLSYYVRSQPDSHFDALVSDDNPGNMAQIGEIEFQRLHTVLQRFYRMIVVDTGNNVRSPNWQAAVNTADLVVVVSTYQRDVGYSGSWVLDHLAQTGREELARNAVTVLTAGDPTTDRTVREQLLQHFSARTRAVIEIPYDTELAHGGPIRWSHLAPATRNAWTMAGATVVDALVNSDVRAMEARRS